MNFKLFAFCVIIFIVAFLQVALACENDQCDKDCKNAEADSGYCSDGYFFGWFSQQCRCRSTISWNLAESNNINWNICTYNYIENIHCKP